MDQAVVVVNTGEHNWISALAAVGVGSGSVSTNKTRTQWIIRMQTTNRCPWRQKAPKVPEIFSTAESSSIIQKGKQIISFSATNIPHIIDMKQKRGQIGLITIKALEI